MNLSDIKHFWYMTFLTWNLYGMNLWYEPLIMNSDILKWKLTYETKLNTGYMILDLDPQFDTTSHSLGMRVSCPCQSMHRWHDSRAGEWWSVPSLFCILFGVLGVMATRGVWMHPRFVSVHVHVMLCYSWWLMVCAIHVFHNSGSWSLHISDFWD